MEVGEIISKHAATNLLNSGATIRRSIAAFEQQTRSAVEQLQKEFSDRLQDRGREWKEAMQAIDAAIDAQLRSAEHFLERPFTIAAGSPGQPASMSPSIAGAIEDELRAVGARLHEEHAAFSEGWTAPSGKQWHERHPLLYAAIAALGGSLLTAIVSKLLP